MIQHWSVFLVLALTVITHAQLLLFDRAEQSNQMAYVKTLKDKQKSYLGVWDGMYQQKQDFYKSRVKQVLVDTRASLETSSDNLANLNVDQDLFDRVSAVKKKDLTKAMSLEMELINLMALTLNSANNLGRDSLYIINVSTLYIVVILH